MCATICAPDISDYIKSFLLITFTLSCATLVDRFVYFFSGEKISPNFVDVGNEWIVFGSTDDFVMQRWMDKRGLTLEWSFYFELSFASLKLAEFRTQKNLNLQNWRKFREEACEGEKWEIFLGQTEKCTTYALSLVHDACDWREYWTATELFQRACFTYFYNGRRSNIFVSLALCLLSFVRMYSDVKASRYKKKFLVSVKESISENSGILRSGAIEKDLRDHFSSVLHFKRGST